MSFINGLLKFYAYLFHLSLSAFLIGTAILARTGHEALRLEMLPFNQERIISRASMLSIIGFLCIFLALVRIYEFVFPLWSLTVIVISVWGFFFTDYVFHGTAGVEWSFVFLVAALLALYGSVMVLMPQRRNRW